MAAGWRFAPCSCSLLLSLRPSPPRLAGAMAVLLAVSGYVHIHAYPGKIFRSWALFLSLFLSILLR